MGVVLRGPTRLVAMLFGALVLILSAASTASAEPPVYLSSFGPDGTSGSNFERAAAVAVDQQTGNVYVLDTLAGSLSRFDADGQPIDFGGSAPYISGNEITGLTPLAGRGESQVAVDSQSHTIYVTGSHELVAFQQDGEPAEFTAGPGAGSNEIPGFGELTGVAVDANGDIYASDYGSGVTVVAPSGEPITQFATSEPANVAVASDGSVYVNRWNGSVRKFTPSEFPVTPTTTYTPAAEPLDPSATYTVAVDPVSGNVYLMQLYPSDFSFSHVAVYDQGGAFIEYLGEPGGEGALADNSSGIAVHGATSKIYVSSDDSIGGVLSRVEIFGPEFIFEGKPSVESTTVSDVTADSATLRSRVNPNTAATTYRFEYGLGDCAVNACTSVPLGGVDIGAGHLVIAVSQHIGGLQGGLTYHYRVVADNSFDTTEGPDRTFTTQTPGAGFQLSDLRAWEMVSPVHKFGGSIEASNVGIVQASVSGDAVAYLSRGSVEAAPEGNRSFELSSVLAQRGGGSWKSKDITPPHAEATLLRFSGEYKLFSPNLSQALMEPRDETPLSVESSEMTPYLRTNSEPHSFRPLVTSKDPYANVSPDVHFAGTEKARDEHFVALSGANDELTHVVFNSEVPLVEGADVRSLYEWSDGALEVVSELPEAESGDVVRGNLGSGIGSIRGAVSEDGSRVFWSTGSFSTGNIGVTGLYLRDTGLDETVRLDVPQSGVSGVGEPRPVFQGASSDGTVVFFTDSRRLTKDASPEGRDLYRCEIPVGGSGLGCASLIDVSAPEPGGSALVRETAPALSKDGARLYFVAEGVLDVEPNELGEVAEPGLPNLYFLQGGQGPRFIASLSTEDSPNWGQTKTANFGVGYLVTAASSPGGRYFTFMSERSLTGYDNRNPFSGELNEEVFLYDAVDDQLICASCSPFNAGAIGQLQPSGAEEKPRPVDVAGAWNGRWVAATLPEASQIGEIAPSIYRPRAVLDNGRVFFNAVDPLVSGDSNGDWDVYQYQPIGLGSCAASAANAALALAGDGCVSLLSSGTAQGGAAFLDASASGDDVFFLTRGRLSVLDKDDAVDVYDARVDGTPAVLQTRAECAGEACQPFAAPPSDSTPASAAFSGEGNIKGGRNCPKGKRKVQRQGKTRCIRRKQRAHGRHQSPAGPTGRAHR